MDGEIENKCPSCDKPLKEGASFCTNCGAAIGAAGEPAAAAVPAGEATQPLPPSEASAVALPPFSPTAGGGGVEAPAPVYASTPAPKKNKAALIVGVIGGILVVAGIVVLVLWLAVWRDGSGGGTSDPINLAEKYLSAMEKGDVDAYLDCFEPGYLEDNPLLESMGMDMKELLEMTFELAEIKLSDYELKLESEKGDKATVVTTSGTLSISTMGFEQEYDLADEPMEFVMVKEGGRWYLTQDPMPGSMGTEMDLEDLNLDDQSLDDLNLEDLNLEDLEQLLPEGMSLEDLENMSPEDLEKLMEELEQLMQDMPSGSTSSST